MTAPRGDRRRAVALAGHTGEVAVARAGLADPEAQVRATALSALDRLGSLDDDEVTAAFRDPAAPVRRRAAQVAGNRPGLSLLALLDDDDPSVIEVAAWACGEQASVTADVLARLVVLTTSHGDALVREASVAALGAIGQGEGLMAILAATHDVATVRRRAVLALAPFEGPDVDEALERARTDRDWQVRQAAEDLLA